MKIKYDFLFTDKTIFLYFNKAKIVMKDGMLVALNGESGIETIPVASTAILMLGYGTSITQEAMLFCSKHNCVICIVRGGFNIHSIFMEGRYRDPTALFNQIELVKTHKLEFAKELLKLRLMINEETKEFNEKVDEIKTESELLGKEGVYSKKIYAKFCKKYNIENFKREFDYDKKSKNKIETEKEIVNRRLNILNNVLYSFCSVLCYIMSLEPSIAFIHGKTRRGGLAFDLADLIKTKIVLPLCFDYKNEKYEKEETLIKELRNNLCKGNKKLIDLLLKILSSIKENKMIKAEELYDSCYSK